MRILITGGDGYIGENLRMSLEKHGHESEICDYGPKVGIKLPLAQKLRVEHMSLFDGVVHLAALSGLAACEKNETEAVEKNVVTAMNVFSKATQAGIPVVFTSSQAAKEPTSSKYASLKWTCERLAMSYNQSGGKNYVIRLSNVYGGYKYLDKKQTCVKQFIMAYGRNKPLVIHGDGEQKRDFIHVLDVCEAIRLILEQRPKDKDPMDIGTGIGISINQLASMFNTDNIVKVNVRNVGTDSSIANTSDAIKRIGFMALRSLNDYIKGEIDNGNY